MTRRHDHDPGSDGPGNVAVSLDRRIRMLRTALGPEIAAALDDPEVVEVMLNPDGSLWVDRLGSGREPTGTALPAPVAERIIRLVAAHVRAEVHAGLPILSAELPETGGRFLGVLPPVVRAPSFAIRKRALRILTLTDYVADGVMTEARAVFLRSAVRERLNIVVAGGTSTGKTTLANALLDEIAPTRDRVLILEDTAEPGVTTMADLVRATLRLRPDRIVVGEVRGAEALDLLKAWGTGHPGGIATVHAGSAARPRPLFADPNHLRHSQDGAVVDAGHALVGCLEQLFSLVQQVGQGMTRDHELNRPSIGTEESRRRQVANCPIGRPDIPNASTYQPDHAITISIQNVPPTEQAVLWPGVYLELGREFAKGVAIMHEKYDQPVPKNTPTYPNVEVALRDVVSEAVSANPAKRIEHRIEVPGTICANRSRRSKCAFEPATRFTTS